MNRKSFILTAALIAITLIIGSSVAQAQGGKLSVSLQQYEPSSEGEMLPSNRIEQWKPSETAFIICDMWDDHWCKSQARCYAELAKAMGAVVESVRKKGVLIVHAPSDCMPYYRDYPARREILKYNDNTFAELAKGSKLPSEDKVEFPISYEYSCEDEPVSEWSQAWSKQHDAIKIKPNDIISDSGSELGAYFKSKGIKNVILAGVATNICIINRSFGLRAMKRMGFNPVVMRDLTDAAYSPKAEPFVDHYTGQELMIEYIEKYICPSMASTDFTGKKPFRFAGDKRTTVYKKPTPEDVKKDRERGIVLPKNEIHYKPVAGYVEDKLDSDYVHASEKAHEGFRDIKYSIRIFWGVHKGVGPWSLLDMSNEERMKYHEEYKTFNPVAFDADEWMDIFKSGGIQAFAFATKHHDGFSYWHTKTRVKRRSNYLNPPENIIEDCDVAYSIEETPFKRDIVKELCDAAHRENIKIDLYFSHPDWYDADFRPYVHHPLTVPDVKELGYAAYGMNFSAKKIMTPNRTPEETKRMVARHREQLRELLTNYGKIDMICLDMWLGKDIWEETKKTVKMMRTVQPDVMIRARGIGSYGDYYQPEQDYSKPLDPDDPESTNMPWMTIRTLGNTFEYDSVAANYKGAGWAVHNLIDCVAKGGCFMVILGPDETGRFHPTAVQQLKEVGEWLRINGEGIYETRSRDVWQKDEIRFTRSKDGKQVYAFVENGKFGNELFIPSVTPRKGSKVRMFGYKRPLKWTQTEQGVRIEIPAELQSPENLPCQHAWGFKFEL